MLQHAVAFGMYDQEDDVVKLLPLLLELLRLAEAQHKRARCALRFVQIRRLPQPSRTSRRVLDG